MPVSQKKIMNASINFSMDEASHQSLICEGEIAQLVGLRHAFHLVTIQAGQSVHTHRGIVKHDDLIGKPWGIQVFSHTGSPFFILKPSIADIIRSTKRNTQIMYPKDIGFILITMGIGPGSKVIEAGTGSGGLTQALAFMVGDSGQVISYEKREEMQRLAQSNLVNLGLEKRVTFKLLDIEKGFDEDDADAIFLDLPNPYDYLPQVRHALKSGGYFGTILPTANQVTKTLVELRRNTFAFTDVCELMLRYYKAEADRFRPTDRMVAHTGFLIFSRKIHQENDLIKDFEEVKE
jgi:tRNA (adenine57-N1/adenine58-N1)-methyltransferase catalytic subunit